MDNKRAIISACCLLSMFAVLISGIITLRENAQKEKENKVYIVNSSTENIPKAEENLGEENGYLVKSQDGKLAVFNPINTDSPIKTTEIYVESLRRYDQNLLEEGITVYGDEALSMILEDFGS